MDVLGRPIREQVVLFVLLREFVIAFDKERISRGRVCRDFFGELNAIMWIEEDGRWWDKDLRIFDIMLGEGVKGTVTTKW